MKRTATFILALIVLYAGIFRPEDRDELRTVLRFMVAEWLIGLALDVIPPRTPEAVALATFILDSWIGQIARETPRAEE